jgi:predicted metalloprotease with PDZ domain
MTPVAARRAVQTLALGLVLVLAGCPTGQRVEDRQAAVMPAIVSYKVQVRPRSVAVVMDVRRPQSGDLVVALRDGSDTWTKIYDIQARVGEDLLEVAATDDPGHWVVRGAEGRRVSIRYLLVAEDHGRVYTGEDAFLAYGRSLLLTPVGAAREATDEVWIEVEAGDWPVATGWGRPDASFTSYDAVIDAVLLAGDWKLTDLSLDGVSVNVAIRGPWASDPGAVTGVRGLLRAIAESQTRVFGRYPSESLLLVVLPAETTTLEAAPQSLILRCPQSSEPEHDVALALQVAEAHFRLWNGARFGPRRSDTAPFREGHAAWFTQGASAWYGLRTAYEVGLLSNDQVVTTLNGWIDAYTAHPDALKATMGDFESRYRKEPSIAQLARLKGALLVALMDIGLRADSNGARSFDLAMRKVAFEFTGRDNGYATKDIETIVIDVGGEDWRRFFTDHVTGVEPLPITRLDRGGLIVLRNEEGVPRVTEVTGLFQDWFKP